MHELPVTQSILEITLRHAQEAGATRVTDLYLVIGQLASVVDDSVQFYWDVLSKDTIAESSRLHFRRVPAEMQCLSCGTRFPLDGDDFACPSCQGVGVKVVAGEEFFLESIEVDGGQASPPNEGGNA
ncbi:MAG: hydrogenase maturation nickel metallochaperone HypA [Chloroflexi bacterium]|nr:hydrogenase maturation nickel metallochaperone HypA [Chloroflexota bacterium]